MIRVLHLEDDPRDAELIQQKLRTNGLACDITWVDRKEAFEAALAQEAFDLVISDYNLPGYDGRSALAFVRQQRPELPVIVVSGTVGEEEAVECLKAGATDYILKQRPQRLSAAVTRALAEKAERERRFAAEHALVESEERFRSAMHHSAVGMALVALDGKWLEVNRALCQVLRYSEQELLATDFQSITYPGDLAIEQKNISRMMAGQIDSCQLEKRYVCKDGHVVWALVGASLLRRPDGEPRHFIFQIQDITLPKQQQEKIARLSRIHSLLSGVTSLIVRTRDPQQLFEEACSLAVQQDFAFAWIGLPAAGRITPVAWAGAEGGYLTEVGQLLERLPGDPGSGGRALTEKRVIVANDIEHDPAVVFKQEALSRGFRSLAVIPLLVAEKTVGVFFLYAHTTGFFDAEEVKLLTDLAGDISFALDKIEKEQRLDYLAYYNALTGLPNRSLFLDRCNQLLRAAEGTGEFVAVIVVDMERFRNFNETLGRHAGDALLRCLAARFKGMRGSVTSIAHLDADNFAFVVHGIRSDIEAAQVFEDEISRAISAPIEFEGTEYRLSGRAGIALGPVDGRDAATLLQNAEAAISRAKRSGERSLFYEPHMNARIAERLTLESRLRVALEKKQFVLHYQPKINLADGRISGMEALIRWNDPEAGLVPPAKFIPLLEETGMILEVGHWAMRQALEDYHKWHALGAPAPRVAVNVSPVQLRRRDFVDVVHTTIRESVTEPHGLDLEITEGLVMEDIEGNIDKLQALRDMGVNIAIDDFGTGYSSLGYLAKLPANALKIDRSFIVTMATSPESMSIVSTIISLARSLKLKVIAEGVETEEQRKVLALLRCDEVQGYLVGRPSPFAVISEVLSAR